MAKRTRFFRPPARPVTVEPVEARVMLSAAHHPAAKHPVKHPAKHPAASASSAAVHPVGLAQYVGDPTPTGLATTAATKSKAKHPVKHPAKHTAKHKAKTPTVGTTAVTTHAITGATTPFGLTPVQVRTAYGLGTPGSTAVSYPVTFTAGNGTAINGDGAGQTIAIVVAYDDPNAASDLHNFSQYYGLPDAPSVTQMNEYGQASPLPSTDPIGPNPASGGSWEEEESLDLEWSHVMAPRANIILYEADSSSGNDIYAAVAAAAANPAVTVVNMSFGGGEDASETADDTTYFTTPTAHAAGAGTAAAGGVTFLAATGDAGAGTEAPSTSPNVVAVGGTSLTLNSDNSYAGESGWGGSGGGISTYESQPTYQQAAASAYATGNRTVPDVSALADPNTGVTIYDSYDFGASTPWLGGGYRFGGTSLATPLWSGVVAVADQGRAVAGLPSLYSNRSGTGTLSRLYQLPGSDFHDVTTGSNGNAATAGYDLVTGRGSPVANTLIPDLAGSAAVAGRAFVDANGNAAYDAGTDTPLSGQTVYIDANNDGVLDDNEPSTTTNAAGQYSFADVTAGGTVRTTTPVGYVAVPTGTSAAVAYGAGQTTNFAYFPTAYASSSAGAQYTLRTDPAGTVDQVLLNGTVVDSVARSALAGVGLSFTLTGTGAGLTVSAANGNPLTGTAGVSVTGTAGKADTLAVVGTSGNDTIAVAAGSVTFGGVAITTANVSAVTVDPGGGTDTLSVTGNAAATVPAPAAGAGVVARQFASLSVSAGSSLSFATAAARSDRQVVVTASLADNGTVDLGGNDMIVHGSTVAAVSLLAKAGFARGTWAGTGLASAAAAADAAHLTALGVAAPASATTFDGQSVTTADVLVKFTYYGDATLDGAVNAADYTRLDAGYVMATTGWANGDFNYDGVVEGSDYSLADNAFNTNRGSL